MPLNKAKGNMYNHKLPKLNVLKRHYFEEFMSAEDIARKYNVTRGAVLIKFRRNNVKRRTCLETQKLNANYVKITDELTAFLNGLLLGDGCLVLSPRKNSCVYGHTDKNRDYLVWLKKQLFSLGVESSTIKPHTNNTWSLKTLYYRGLEKIRNRWYLNNKKAIPDITLTPITLFNWYIGDGSYDKKSKSEKVIICSEFDPAGREKMSEKLKFLGIANSIYSNGIYIKSSGRETFFRYIRDHNYSIPEDYKYKFREV